MASLLTPFPFMVTRIGKQAALPTPIAQPLLIAVLEKPFDSVTGGTDRPTASNCALLCCTAPALSTLNMLTC